MRAPGRLPTDGMFRDLFAIGSESPTARARISESRRNKFKWDWHLRNLLMACMPAGAAWLSAVVLERFFNSEKMQDFVAEVRQKAEAERMPKRPVTDKSGELESSRLQKNELDEVRQNVTQLQDELRDMKSQIGQIEGKARDRASESSAPVKPTPAASDTVFDWPALRATRKRLFGKPIREK